MAVLTGSCLCGAVRYSAEGEVMMAGDCFCVDCRKSSGTAHCTHVAVAAARFDVAGAVATYERPADSGNLVTRAFCPACGSPLYSTNAAMPGAVFLRASCLDDPDAVAPAMTVFAARAPAWARINAGGPVFDGMPQGVMPQGG